jgi:uncharacterized protein
MLRRSRPRRASVRVAGALAALCAACVAVAPARAQVAVPPVARVTDLTGTLREDERGALDRKLAAFEARKGSQIAVLVVPTTEPEDIAQYGIRVADAWKLGRKGVDDGAIVLVAKGDRRMRIEVGRGLEGAVTDLAANRIIDEFMRPHFRAGDFYGGIDSAVDRLIALTDGEPLPAPQRREWERRPGGFQSILPILLVIGLIGGSVLRRVLGRPLGAAATGGIAAFVAHALLGVLGISIFAGVAAFLFTLLGGLGGNALGTGRGGFGGGLGGLGGFGGGLGGGGFGGGGFSGGGGGFSGGGASGSW